MKFNSCGKEDDGGEATTWIIGATPVSGAAVFGMSVVVSCFAHPAAMAASRSNSAKRESRGLICLSFL